MSNNKWRNDSMKANKRRTTQKILEAGQIIPCVKLEECIIFFPEWKELGILGKMLRQCIVTKEQPDGQIYDENNFQIVMKIINGKIEWSCMEKSKVKKIQDKTIVGSNSAEGMNNVAKVLMKISDENERKLFLEMLQLFRKDFQLLISPADKRVCIEVTQQMFDGGITYCVESWVMTDEIGAATVTNLVVGDYLILEDIDDEPCIYRISREEFFNSYQLEYTSI